MLVTNIINKKRNNVILVLYENQCSLIGFD